jgi:RNA polymerase sigma-70 factor (ECF subfamily)
VRDLKAIERVYRARYSQFVRFATAELGSREAAHDAVQDTFARAIRSRRGFRGQGTLDAWIWRILINVCASARRGHPAVAAAEDETASDPAPDLADVRAALAELPERQRLALFLRHYADLDYEAIATALGVERGTVAATLHAARERLRHLLSEVPHA